MFAGLGNIDEVVFQTPPEERFRALERLLKWELGVHTWMRRRMFAMTENPPKFRYSCTEELVLFNASPVLTHITDCQFPAMQVGNCFANAMALSLRHPELRYTEGWACMEQSIPTHHAWVTHSDGSVSDPTWLSLVTGDTRRTIPGYRARCAYMGVTIPRANHLAWFREHETPNLLAFGEMMPVDVLTHGMDAFSAQLPEDVIDAATGLVLDAIGAAPQWTFNGEAQAYERQRPDGTIEQWTGRGNYTG